MNPTTSTLYGVEQLSDGSTPFGVVSFDAIKSPRRVSLRFAALVRAYSNFIPLGYTVQPADNHFKKIRPKIHRFQGE